VVGGIDYYHNNIFNETWQYNPATDNWTKKADLPLARFGATGFSIGNKGYIVNGTFALGYLTSLLEYDQSGNSWTFKANFPGQGRIESQCFVISGNAYVGGGETSPQLQDFYKYDQGNNSWSQIEDIPTSHELQNSFSINSYGYVAWYNSANGNQKMEKYTPRTCGSFKSAN
jgi:N-acetylneuraminic acid mutarotase